MKVVTKRLGEKYYKKKGIVKVSVRITFNILVLKEDFSRLKFIPLVLVGKPFISCFIVLTFNYYYIQFLIFYFYVNQVFLTLAKFRFEY